MQLQTTAMVIGAVAAVTLIAGLAAGLSSPRWQIWPAPPARSWKSLAFWTLFRSLNVAVLAVAIADLLPALLSGAFDVAQAPLVAISLALFAIYLRSLWSLGRTATYCQASGLATQGLYRLSRNPQYATAIAAYATLGLATEALSAMALSASLVAVYALMAISEEPWLEARYGKAYWEYREDVPRFFSPWHAASELIRALGERPRRLTEETQGGGR